MNNVYQTGATSMSMHAFSLDPHEAEATDQWKEWRAAAHKEAIKLRVPSGEVEILQNDRRLHELVGIICFTDDYGYVSIVVTTISSPFPRMRPTELDISAEGWWRRKRYPAPVVTCTNSLTEVNCPSKYYIQVKRVTFYSTTSICDRINTNCPINELKDFCNEKRICLSHQTTNTCLYHRRFASIQYVCKGPTDNSVTASIQSTPSDHELETTAIAALNITTNNDDELPYLILDTDHRVVIYQHSLKQNQFYICGSEWDDSDATVVCKSINSTWIGNATLVDKLLNIPTLPHSLHCGGLEADVFACNFTESETGCNETKVAGALCCQGTPGRCVTNLSSDDLPQVKSESLTLASIKVIMVSTLVFIIVAALVIIVIVCHRKRKTKNSKPCQIRQNTPANERMDSSDYNVINYNEMTDISIPKINENINETHTTQHQTQHITTSIEQEDTICNKYESLSTNRNSVEHFYESDSIHTNQYESLTKQREMDKHTYESTEQALPQDIKTSMELEDNICKKYESLSTNQNSVEHTYESDSIHTNQYESLTKQRELDEHTYESTEHALPVSMEQELSQYQSFTNPPESDKNVYASTGSPQ